MTDLLAWFTTPVQISGVQHLALLAPLCVSISVVYKTIRCQDLRDVPLAALGQSLTIIIAMFGVGVVVWLLYLLMS